MVRHPLLFFSVHRPVSVERHQVRQEFVTTPASDAAPAGYVTSVSDFADLQRTLAATGQQDALEVLDEDDVLAAPGAPVELGVSNRDEAGRSRDRKAGLVREMPFRALADQLPALAGGDPVRTAILNGFGTGIGDHIVGLTAWRVAHERMADAGLAKIHNEIWSRTHGTPRARVTCANEATIADVRTLPLPIAELMQLDGFWDLSGLLSRPSFSELPTVDFFLETLGVDPATVPDERKRNRIGLPPQVEAEIDAAVARLGRPYVVLHPVSSTPLRDMPVPVMRRFFDELARRSDFLVGSLHGLPFRHERLVDMSRLFRTHQHFCAVVGRAAGLLSIDTSTYHIADAFSVPSLVVFTTVPPERWVNYYPTVEAVMLDGVRESPYLGMHTSRDPNVLRFITGCWDRLDVPGLVERFLQRVSDGRAR